MKELSRNNEGIIGIIIGIFILLLIVGLVVGTTVVWFQSQNDRYNITGTVEKKWIDYGDGDSYYLLKIRLQNGEPKMLEVNRNIFHGSNYNPDFVFSDIQVNHTYTFTCWGWDWQWSGMYMYPMVIIADEIRQ